MTTLQEIEPEWNEPNSVNVTTFLHEGKKYTISTCQLSASPMPAFTMFVTALGDRFTGNEDKTDQDYETMLFIDGASNGEDVYPFGDLPGNEIQGIFQRYSTEEEAREGHTVFTDRIKQILLSRQGEREHHEPL